MTVNAAVSVVLPCRNEEQGIGICIEKIQRVFRQERINGEIIVSDCSTDSSAEIAERLGAKVVKNNGTGYGNAYMQGFRAAAGSLIVMGDSDDSYDFLEMPKLFRALEHSDFVIGSRMKGEIKPGAMRPLHRYIGNPLLNFLFNLFFRAGISDTHSGFRAIKSDAFRRLELSCRGMEFALEMIIEAKRKGLRISEVPITYSPRKGESKLNSFRDGWKHLRFIFGNLYPKKYKQLKCRDIYYG